MVQSCRPERHYAKYRLPCTPTWRTVVGHINPTQVSINGQVVIDQMERVGSPIGLQGPAGPDGPPGPAGPKDPAGCLPDTPAQVLDKLVQVDGATSALDADKLDGFQASDFLGPPHKYAIGFGKDGSISTPTNSTASTPLTLYAPPKRSSQNCSP